jgi:hypothetical protein
MSHQPSRYVALALFIATLGLAGCNNYEPKQTIEGVYRPPSGCARLQGHRDDWFSFTTVYPTVCNPIRVSELGIFTYGGNWSSPGKKVEMGRLEFPDGGVYVKTEALRLGGSFEYRTRKATLGDWTRHNPFKTIMIVLVGIVVAVTVVVQVVPSYSRRKRERERLEAEEAARPERLKAEEAARLGRLEAEEAARLGRLKAEEARKAEEAAQIEHHTEWIRQLQSNSVDQLRFEYEKRQRSIQVLHARIAERNHAYGENEETMRRWPDNDDIQITCLNGQIKIMDQITDLNKNIADAEREMTAIQRALDTKWH